MWLNLQFPADLVAFTEEVVDGKLHLLCVELKYFFLKRFVGLHSTNIFLNALIALTLCKQPINSHTHA